MSKTSDDQANRRAMALSVAAGVAMLVIKAGAYSLTGSSAILSDAAESVIHLAAVGFAAFSLRLSTRPANARFPYGYERIEALEGHGEVHRTGHHPAEDLDE